MASLIDTATENSVVYNPESLFDICVKYIARNIAMVESLNGFPEIIGERLWTSCVESGHFLDDNDVTQYCIRLFVEAYGGEFMESFGCGSPQLINEYCESLTIMCVSVTHLDVSGCRLGNSNDLLRAIVNMKDLKVLNLSRNELSEDGFRLLLARYRMYKEGFQVLETCDVSENIVSLKTLNTFLKMSQLRNIRVSVASSLKMKVPKFVQDWTANIKKCKFRILPPDQVIASSIITKGLAAQIISVWEGKVAEWEAARLRKVEEKAQSFYACSAKQSKSQVFKPGTDGEKFDTYSYTRDSVDELLMDGKKGGSNSKRKSDVLQVCRVKKKKEHDLNMDLLRIYRS